MELVTEADQHGLQGDLAQSFASSALKQRNDADLDGFLVGPNRGSGGGGGGKLVCRAPTGLGDGSEGGEMAAARATATPWWWGIKTLLQVGAALAAAHDCCTVPQPAACSSGAAWRLMRCRRQGLPTLPPTYTHDPGLYAHGGPHLCPALPRLLQYRTLKNYRDPEYVGPRIADKLIMALLVLTLYLNIGRKEGQENLINISAVLFMWCVLPAFGAAAYVPSIVLGKWPGVIQPGVPGNPALARGASKQLRSVTARGLLAICLCRLSRLFSADRGLFVRERSDGLYRTSTYLVGA